MKYLLMLLLLYGMIGPTVIAAPNAYHGNNVRLLTIQNNSLVGISNPNIATAKNIALELLLQEIIRRESGGNPEACNVEFGCGSGRGLTQIISSTERMCEEALGKELDVFNPEDNLECARWLLSQPYGIKNWEPWSGPYPKHLIAALYDN